MNSHYLFLLALILLVIIPWITRQRRLAAVKQILNRKKQNKENNVMKELAKQFIGEECIIYTVTSNDGSVLGVIKEIGDGSMIIERKSFHRSNKRKKPAIILIELWRAFWRRCGDSNPSTGRTRLPDFESGPFNRLGTSPCFLIPGHYISGGGKNQDFSAFLFLSAGKHCPRAVHISRVDFFPNL